MYIILYDNRSMNVCISGILQVLQFFLTECLKISHILYILIISSSQEGRHLTLFFLTPTQIMYNNIYKQYRVSHKKVPLTVTFLLYELECNFFSIEMDIG